jgi:hypothetical protein
MDRACDMYGEEEKYIKGFGGETCRNDIKMDLKEVGCMGVEWIQMAQDRDKWLAVVNMVMNLQVP